MNITYLAKLQDWKVVQYISTCTEYIVAFVGRLGQATYIVLVNLQFLEGDSILLAVLTPFVKEICWHPWYVPTCRGYARQDSPEKR